MSDQWEVGSFETPEPEANDSTADELMQQLNELTDLFGDQPDALQMATQGLLAVTMIECLRRLEEIKELTAHHNEWVFHE